MDVGDPSNFERLRWLFAGDLEAMRRAIVGVSVTDDEIRAAIARDGRSHGYVADPHTAIGWVGAKAADVGFAAPTVPRVVLATAHPAKFGDVVGPVLGREIELPPALAERLALPPRAISAPPALAAIVDVLTCRAVSAGLAPPHRIRWPRCERCEMILARPRRAVPDPERSAIDPVYTWDLSSIFASWDDWDAAMADLEQRIGAFKALAGTLGLDGAHLRAALEDHDAIGQLSYRVWYYPSLTHDQDQRDNASAARRQRVQLLFARLEHATSWFNPELLKVPLPAIHAWMDADPALAVYRFAVDDLFRKQAHVLDHDGERLLSLASRLSGAPRDAYETLSTADATFPDHHAVERRDRAGDLRPVPPGAGHQPGRRRPARGLRCALRRLRGQPRTPMPRSTTACCTATGSRPGPAATRPRSTRRCSATRSRPRS